MLKPVTLKNGITLLKMPKNSAESFVIGFVVKTGSSVEYGNYPFGLSHMVERLFWKGTDKHPSVTSLNQTLEGMGGEFVSHTGKELTEYYLKVPAYQAYKAISLLAEIIQHSTFTERDVEQEKERMLAELNNFETVLEQGGVSEVSTLTTSHIYEKQGLGTPTKGTIESIMLMNQQYVADYLAHQYVPQNCFLIVAGSYETKSCMELLEQEWNLWNPRPLQPRSCETYLDLQLEVFPKLQFRQRGLSRTQMDVSFVLDGGFVPLKSNEEEMELTQTSGLSSAQYAAQQTALSEKRKAQLLTDWSKLALLNTILGQGLSSRLWLKCVEDEVLFDSVTSSLELFEHTGFIQIHGITTENTQFTFALESILSVLDSLKKTTLSINEFTKAREYLKGRLILDQEDSIGGIVWQTYLYITTGFDIDKYELIEYIQKVDVNQIRSLAMDLFIPDRMAITTLGTAKHTTLIDKLITKYLGSKS